MGDYKYTAFDGSTLELNDYCMQTDPCQHVIKVNGKPTKLVNRDLKKWFTSRNMVVPREVQRWCDRHAYDRLQNPPVCCRIC